MSECSANLFAEVPRAKNKCDVINALITEALEENELVMASILHPGEIGVVAILGYEAQDV